MPSGNSAPVLVSANRRSMPALSAESEVGIIKACAQGNVDRVRSRLLSDPSLVDSANQCGMTPLMAASFHGHYAVSSLLLNSGADIDACNHSGTTALHFAVINNHVQVAELLLKFGANAFLQETRGKCNALQLAILHNHVEMRAVLEKNMQIRMAEQAQAAAAASSSISTSTSSSSLSASSSVTAAPSANKQSNRRSFFRDAPTMAGAVTVNASVASGREMSNDDYNDKNDSYNGFQVTARKSSSSSSSIAKSIIKSIFTRSSDRRLSHFRFFRNNVL